MKTSLQHLLISFIGSLLALACFMGIFTLFDDDEQTDAPLDKKVIAYFDANDISYEELDSDLYSFSYNNHKYLWRYYLEDKLYLRIISSWENELTDRGKLLELTNQMEDKLKCIKIVVEDDNSISFSVEYFVSRDSDIDGILSRSLELMESAILETLDKQKEF